MAADDVEQISTPAPSYHSNSLLSSSSSFDADLDKAILEHLTPLPPYIRDGTYAPPNTPAPTEKEDDVVGVIESERVETPREREEREEREREAPWFTIQCTILVMIICVALVVGLCVFALY